MKHGEERPDLGRVSELAKNCEERADEIVRRSSRMLDQTIGRLPAAPPALPGGRRRRCARGNSVHAHGRASEHRQEEHLNARGARRTGQPRRPRIRPLPRKGSRSLSHRKPGQRSKNSSTAVDQLAELRHQVASAERIVRERLIRNAADFRELHVASAIAQGFDQAAHTLARCGLIVRDYVLNTTPGRAQIP